MHPGPNRSASCAETAADARTLNRTLDCPGPDSERLRQLLEPDPSLYGLAAGIANSRPQLFSATAVFIDAGTFAAMAELVAAVEEVLALPACQAGILARAPAIARADPGPLGLFMAHDFHLCADGPQLIEINTNAGGALLNRALALAQQPCDEPIASRLQACTDPGTLDRRWVDDFIDEWRRQGRSGRPQRIAIVDEHPQEQFLYPEFLLVRQLLRSAGIEALICDPGEFRLVGNRLLLDDAAVDLVYNRLTDFYLQSPRLAVLRAAYERDAVVLTPHPHAHALHADKRNLALLSDPQRLAALGVQPALISRLVAGIPPTVEVGAANAEALWADRRRLFFKPCAGFGSRAAYRGDKLTRRVWRDILAGAYVAQHIAPPATRRLSLPAGMTELKFDVRAHVHAGRIRLLAARLYSGQTTNFRTPGGGFAPVLVIGDREGRRAGTAPGAPG